MQPVATPPPVAEPPSNAVTWDAERGCWVDADGCRILDETGKPF